MPALPARRLGRALVGTAAFALAAGVAARHPLWPAFVVGGVCLWTVATACRPGVWLTVVPASLPWLDVAPWTGWLMVDEFDLLLLATVAGGWLRAAALETSAVPGRRRSKAVRALVLLCAASAVIGLLRGWADADAVPLDLYQGHVDPLNSLRIAKSLLLSLLLAPLLRRELDASAPLARRRICIGMWAGMTVVAVAVAWERFLQPGLFDFSTPYRTTALFWEMHVGGAALDVYVAVASPFAAWAVWSARSTRAWAAAAALAVAWAYVGLTTFSRGVYGAVVVAFMGLAWLIWTGRRPRPRRWRRLGDALLAGVLLLEAVLVLRTGSFLGSRIASTDRDLSSRMSHWRHGVQLLRTPLEALIGLGPGRLPAHYAAEVPRREFPGAARAFGDAKGEKPGYLLLSGPRSVGSLGGLFGVTQRVPLVAGARYAVDLAVRARTDTELRLLVCEMHLLYPRRCQSAALWLPAAQDGPWVSLALPLAGPSLDPGPALAPRLGVLVLSVGNAAGAVALSDLQLSVPGRSALVRNGRFTEGMAHWFPVAQRYFLPWHIDNFLLETLIERGALGLLVLAGWVVFALRHLLREGGARPPIAPFIAAAIVSVVLVGLVSSVMDMPRVAFLFFLLLLVAGHSGIEESSTTAA